MVQVVIVEDEEYEIPDSWTESSNTIKDLLANNPSPSPSSQEPIVLNVSGYDWDAYLRFLRTEQPNIQALRVIDYLDDIEMARQWVLLSRFPLFRESTPESVKHALKQTHFSPEDIGLIFFQQNVKDILPHIQKLSWLPPTYIEYIINELYPSGYKLYLVYAQTLKYKDINTIPKTVFDSLL